MLLSDVRADADDDDQDGTCTTAKSTFDAAIAAALGEVGGDAVGVELEGCDVEVEVLSADELYEVRVAPDGSIASVEKEDDEED